MAIRILSGENITGNVHLTDEKILAFRSTNDYSIQYRDLDFRFIGSADGTTNRYFSFGHYTSDNPAGTWNGKVYINSYTGAVGIGANSPGRKLTVTDNVSGDANNLLLSNENDTNGDSASIGFSMLSNNTYVKSGIFFERTTTQGRGSLHLAVNNEVNGNNVTKSDAKLTINNTGNIGIGTNDPDAKVHIFKSSNGATTVGTASDELILENDTDCGLTIRSAADATGVVSFASPTDHNVGQLYYNHDDDSMVIRTNDAIRTIIGSSGIMYIMGATASTNNSLQLQYNSTAGTAEIYSKSTGGNTTFEFYTSNSGTTTQKFNIGSSGDVKITTNGKFLQGVRNTGGSVIDMIGFGAGTDRLQIKGGTSGGAESIAFFDTAGQMATFYNSRFGIGNTTPKFALNTNLAMEGASLAYLDGTSNNQTTTNNIGVTHNASGFGGTNGVQGGLFLANNNNANNAPSPIIFFGARSASNTYNHAYAAIYGIKTGGGADSNWNVGELTFATGQGTGPIRRMTINKDGNVGIGTTSPNAKLNIVGSTEGTYLNVNAIAGNAGIGSTQGAMVKFYNDGDGHTVKIQNNNSSRTDATVFSVWTQTNSRFLILNDGKIGIGTTSPTAKLDIDGDVRYRGDTYSEFTYNGSGNYSNGTIYTVANTSQLTVNGIYQIVMYLSDYGAGGGTYMCWFCSVPFYWVTTGTNRTVSQTLPTLIGTGHAIGTIPTFYITQELGTQGAQAKVRFDPNNNWTGIDGSSSKKFQVYIKRLGG